MASIQPVGLAVALDWGDAGVKDKLVFTALATSAMAMAGPLAAISYRSKGLNALGRMAAAVAGPVAACALQPSTFSSSALAPAVDADAQIKGVPKALPELKSIWSLFAASNLSKMLAKNVLVQMLMGINPFMMQLLDHEQAALAAEAQGQPAPAPPPFPDLLPFVQKGLFLTGRELAVATTRRVYEHITAAQLPPNKAQAFLRDGRSWARDVLAVKYASSSVSRRAGAYFCATLHSSSLFYAADCTVSVVQHTARTVSRKKPLLPSISYWVKGVVLQVARCSLTLLGAAIGASIGSLIKPGTGTYAGQLLAEVGLSIALGGIVHRLLADKDEDDSAPKHTADGPDGDAAASDPALN